MTRAFHAAASEPWAIQPAYLEGVLLPLALRLRDDPAVLDARAKAADEDNPRHVLEAVYAGPAVKRLEGGSGGATVSNGVAVIPVLGPIFPRANMMTMMSGATSVTMLRRDLDAAIADDGVNSILLAVDSPGGAVSGVNGFADAVYAARKIKPVGAHVLGTAASAAYWIAAQAERISIERTGIVGSIGVVMAVPKQVEPDQRGDMVVELVSTNAPNKRPDPTKDDGAAEIIKTLDAIEAEFVADVARGREVDVATVLEKFGQGGVETGKAAVSAKMANKVQRFEDALSHMARVGKAYRRRQQAER